MEEGDIHSFPPGKGAKPWVFSLLLWLFTLIAHIYFHLHSRFESVVMVVAWELTTAATALACFEKEEI